MSNAALAQDETEDRYYTQVDAGDVRLFTLDQLDAAFNAGLIHENTYVCLEGSSEWLTLGEVAGLGEEEEAAPVSAPQPVPVPQYTAPIAVPQYAAPSPQYAPVTATRSVAPQTPYSVAPVSMPRSIAPVTNDLSLDDDLEMLSMRPKRRLGKVLAGAAVLALGGLGFAVVQSGGLRLPKLSPGVEQASAASLSMPSLKQTETKPASTPAPTPAPEAAKPEPPKEEAKPAESAASDGAKAEKAGSDRFTEEMKAALLNKDQKQAATQKQKKASRAAVATKSGRGKAAKGAAGGFKAGGSAYDPLNGKL
jgi:hypothetical protein